MASLRSPTRGCYSNHGYSAHQEYDRAPMDDEDMHPEHHHQHRYTPSRRRLSWHQQREPPVGAPTATWRCEDHHKATFVEDPRRCGVPHEWSPGTRGRAEALPAPRIPPRSCEDPRRYDTPPAWSPETRRRADALVSPRVAPRSCRPPQRRCSLAEPRTPRKPPLVDPGTPTKQPAPPRRPQHRAAAVDATQSSPSRSSLKASWITLPEPHQEAPTATLCLSGLLLLACGLVICVAGFCFLAWDGRRYFLDIALVSGFTAFLLGAAGLRSRAWLWFPNRNYVSGYILLTIFSMLTAAGLLVLLINKPRPGTPLADMVGGAICGVSGLSLLLAGLGVIASQCCKYPPPDNRVQHCTEGFVI